MKKRYKVGGKIYEIEEAEVSAFLQDFPNAIEVKNYNVGGKKYEIPLAEVDAFETDFGLKKKESSLTGKATSPSTGIASLVGKTANEVPELTKEIVNPGITESILAGTSPYTGAEKEQQENLLFARPSDKIRYAEVERGVKKDQERHVKDVLDKVSIGYTTADELFDLGNTPYGASVVKQLFQQYHPTVSQDIVLNEGSHWEEAAKAINTANSKNRIDLEVGYSNRLDQQLQNELSKIQTGDVFVSGGTGGAAARANYKKLPQIDLNDPSAYGPVIDAIQSATILADESGKTLPGKKQELLDLLFKKLDVLKSKQGIDPEILALDSKINDAVTRVNIKRESGEDIPVEKFALADDINKQHFQIGLNWAKDADPGTYKNVIRAIDRKQEVADTDFRILASKGQQLLNQKTFIEAGSNPEFLGKETDIDYTTYEEKKSDYALKIGEWLKDQGYSNVREFQPSQIKMAADALGLTNKTIVDNLTWEEGLIGYDAIPKTGAVEVTAKGILQPISSIGTTINTFFESPSETYLRSKKLSGEGTGQLVFDEKGQASQRLPSDRGNVLYDALEGFGQFATQVLLTKGIGGAVTSATRGALKAVPKASLSNTQAGALSTYGGTFASTFLQEYGSAYSNMLQKTGDAQVAKIGGAINGGAAAGFELLLPDVKIADRAMSAFKSGGVMNDVIDLIRKGGNIDELAKKGRPIFEKFVKNLVNTQVQEISEEEGTNIVNYLTELTFSPRTAKDRNLFSELIETAKATAVSMSIPSLLGAGGGSLNRDFTVNTLHSAAINLDDYKTSLRRSLINETISQEEHDKALKLLSTHRNSISTAPPADINGKELSQKQKLDYAFQETQIKINKARAENAEGVQKEVYERKIKDAEDIQRSILIPETKGPDQQSDIATEETTVNKESVAQDVKLNEDEQAVINAVKNNLSKKPEGSMGKILFDAAQDPAQHRQIINDLVQQSSDQAALLDTVGDNVLDKVNRLGRKSDYKSVDELTKEEQVSVEQQQKLDANKKFSELMPGVTGEAEVEKEIREQVSVEDKLKDIEKRRQEELKQEEYRIPAEKESRSWVDDDGTNFETVITTFKDGHKETVVKNLDNGSQTPKQSYPKELSNEKIYESESASKVSEQKSVKLDVPEVKIVSKINAKYDAELAALEKQSPAQTEQKPKAEQVSVEDRKEEKVTPIKNRKTFNFLKQRQFGDDFANKALGEFKGKDGRRYYIQKRANEDNFFVIDAEDLDNQVIGKSSRG